MRTRLRLACLVMVLLLGAAPQGGAAGPMGEASKFMEGLGNQVIDLVKDRQHPEAERKAQFRQLLDQSFDMPAISRFVLGRYWRTASDQEKKQFAASFEGYMIQVYWSRFSSYSGESFRVLSEQDEGNGTILVTTEVVRPRADQAPVKVSWAIVRRDSGFKIRDASLEGVSQALTYRDEFASIMERNGGQVAALIRELDARQKG